MRRETSKPEDLLTQMAEVAEQISILETKYHIQMQSIKSLQSKIPWHNTESEGFLNFLGRMERIGSSIQSNISNKVDVLFQLVSSQESQYRFVWAYSMILIIDE
jgi:hypothetical protein